MGERKIVECIQIKMVISYMSVKSNTIQSMMVMVNMYYWVGLE